MVHILLRTNYPVLSKTVQRSRLPHLQFLAGYQISARRAATDAGRGTTGSHDAWWKRTTWTATEWGAAVQMRKIGVEMIRLKRERVVFEYCREQPPGCGDVSAPWVDVSDHVSPGFIHGETVRSCGLYDAAGAFWSCNIASMQGSRRSRLWADTTRLFFWLFDIWRKNMEPSFYTNQRTLFLSLTTPQDCTNSTTSPLARLTVGFDVLFMLSSWSVSYMMTHSLFVTNTYIPISYYYARSHSPRT